MTVFRTFPTVVLAVALTCTSFMVATVTSGLTYEISLNTHLVLSTTEDEYLSFCLDPYLKHDLTRPWGTLNFSHPRVHTLARGLAPALLRFGGTDADWSVFYNVTSQAGQDQIWDITNKVEQGKAFIVPLFPQDIDNLQSIATSASGKLLFDLNIQQRYGEQWNPNNALQLMQYVIEHGYSDRFDFELGNEPFYPALHIDGVRIGQDFLILRKLIDQMPAFENSRLVGPDVSIEVGGTQFQIAKDFASTVKRNVSALTCHFYYFAGPEAKVSQYFDVEYFDRFDERISTWRDLVQKASGSNIDVWVGETSDSYNKGTPNLTDRYVSGFLWLDKLGVAARNGYKLVARQDFYGGNYPLVTDKLEPTPDYWLSYVFKQLVGRRVLKVGINTTYTTGQRFRVYGHCTSPRANYSEGSITLFMVNIYAGAVDFYIDPNFYGASADLYLLTPLKGDILSTFVELNGERLELINDSTLPVLNKKDISLGGSIRMDPLTYGFVVLKYAKAKACLS